VLPLLVLLVLLLSGAGGGGGGRTIRPGRVEAVPAESSGPARQWGDTSQQQKPKLRAATTKFRRAVRAKGVELWSCARRHVVWSPSAAPSVCRSASCSLLL
jgi:hypothetical protein